MKSVPTSRSGHSGEEGTLSFHLRISWPERGGGLRGRQRYKYPSAARRCRRPEVNSVPAKPGVRGALKRRPQSRRRILREPGLLVPGNNVRRGSASSKGILAKTAQKRPTAWPNLHRARQVLREICSPTVETVEVEIFR